MGRSTQAQDPVTETPENGTPDMTPFVDALLTTGETLKAEKVALIAKVKGNRDMLRALVAQGVVHPEQTAKIAALYPRATKDAETATEPDPDPADGE